MTTLNRALNEGLTLADWTWHRNFNLQSGVYGPQDDDVSPRVVNLALGQPLFRWCDSSRATKESCAAGAWWSTKRGAATIIRQALYRDDRDSAPIAQKFSNVLPSWNDCRKVVCVTVIRPIRCFIGVGKKIVDDDGEDWDSRELQLYIPNMTSKSAGRVVLNPYAANYIRINWVQPSNQINVSLWQAATGLDFGHRNIARR